MQWETPLKALFKKMKNEMKNLVSGKKRQFMICLYQWWKVTTATAFAFSVL